ncbi:MAG: SfnB family sulfur acquisition oxidoreductase [Sphingomonadales bacterium]|nr:MAG: SfnB family sulfur acquisition oxidoreductase [Sphingomonadales bacterium]
MSAVVRVSKAIDASVRHIASEAAAIAAAHELAALLADGAIARDRDQLVPRAEMDALSRSGLLAITVPASHGGADVSFATVAEVFRILSAADPAIGQIPQNHFVCVNVLREAGTPEQQAFFFAEVLRGARFGNAQAERGTASSMHIATSLKPNEDGFLLNGSKYYCTGALTADWIPVAALDPEDRSVFVYVPREAEGVEVLADWDPIGQRVTFSGTVHLRDVPVTPDLVVEQWRSLGVPGLNHAFLTLMHAAIDVGIARDAFGDLVRELCGRTRPRHGARVTAAGEDPYVLADLGRFAARLAALEAGLLTAAATLDIARAAGLDARNTGEAVVAASGVKGLAEDVSIAISSELFALLGSSSIERGRALDRHWRNARTHTVHDANQWRYRLVGDWRVNGAVPPPLGRRRET